MQISLVCQSPDCVQQGEAINTVSGIPPEMMEAFIEAWRGEDRADTCASCGNMGVLDDTTLAAEQPGEDEAYRVTLLPLSIFNYKD